MCGCLSGPLLATWICSRPHCMLCGMAFSVWELLSAQVKGLRVADPELPLVCASYPVIGFPRCGRNPAVPALGMEGRNRGGYGGKR